MSKLRSVRPHDWAWSAVVVGCVVCLAIIAQDAFAGVEACQTRIVQPLGGGGGWIPICVDPGATCTTVLGDQGMCQVRGSYPNSQPVQEWVDDGGGTLRKFNFPLHAPGTVNVQNCECVCTTHDDQGNPVTYGVPPFCCSVTMIEKPNGFFSFGTQGECDIPGCPPNPFCTPITPGLPGSRVVDPECLEIDVG